jgi:hypothetical protein
MATLTLTGGTITENAAELPYEGEAAADGGGGGGDPGTGDTPTIQKWKVVNRSATVPIPAGSPIIFGNPVAPGDLDPATQHLVFRLASDASAVAVQQYHDEATSHPDGSLSMVCGGILLPAPVPAGGALEFTTDVAAGAKSQAASGITLADLSAEDWTVEIDVNEAGTVRTYEATLAEGVTGSLWEGYGTGPVCRLGKGIATFRLGALAHPDLWCEFFPFAYVGGQREMMVKVNNGWGGNGVNYPIRGLRLLKAGVVLQQFASRPATVISYASDPLDIFQLTYHSSCYLATDTGWHYQSHDAPEYDIFLDRHYAAKARAVFDHDDRWASLVKPVALSTQTNKKPKGYMPTYFPGDPAGIETFLGAAGDAFSRGGVGYSTGGELCYLFSGGGLTGWGQYCMVTALAYGALPNQYRDKATGQCHVVNNSTYAGMPAPDPTWGTGPTFSGTLRNPKGANQLGWKGGVSTSYSFGTAGGWHGTDAAAPGIPTGTGAVSLQHDHYEGIGKLCWLMSGRPWFYAVTANSGAHAVSVKLPGSGNRQVVLGSTTYYGVMGNNQPRDRAWSLRDVDDAHFFSPDSRKAKTYFRDLVEVNTKFYKLAMDALYITANQQALGFIMPWPGGSKMGVFHMYHWTCAMAQAHRRGRPLVEEAFAVAYKAAFFWNVCKYRSAADQFALKPVSTSADTYFTSWADLLAGAGSEGPAAFQKVPFVPTVTPLPTSRLEDGNRQPWAQEIIDDPDQPWASGTTFNHGWLWTDRKGTISPGRATIPGQARQACGAVLQTTMSGYILAAAQAFDDYLAEEETIQGYTLDDYVLTPRYSVRGVDSIVPAA